MKCIEHEFEYDPECEECIIEYRHENQYPLSIPNEELAKLIAGF